MACHVARPGGRRKRDRRRIKSLSDHRNQGGANPPVKRSAGYEFFVAVLAPWGARSAGLEGTAGCRRLFAIFCNFTRIDADSAGENGGIEPIASAIFLGGRSFGTLAARAARFFAGWAREGVVRRLAFVAFNAGSFTALRFSGAFLALFLTALIVTSLIVTALIGAPLIGTRLIGTALIVTTLIITGLIIAFGRLIFAAARFRALLAAIEFVLEEIFFLAAFRTRATLIVFRCTGIGRDPEIVIRELQIILGLHPVAIHRGVLCELAVFFQHLRSVAASAAVNPIDRTATLGAIIAPTTTTIVIVVVTVVIVTQRKFTSSTGTTRHSHARKSHDPSPTERHPRVRGPSICIQSGGIPAAPCANVGIGPHSREIPSEPWGPAIGLGPSRRFAKS